MIYNLLDNAIKFTPQGNVKLTFKTIEIGSKVECYIDISDTGVGIPEGELRHIFTDFYQTDNGHSKVFKGTGLGLAISKKLVGLHGGDIHVRSTLGAGSTFSLFLPLEQGEELALSQHKEPIAHEEFAGMTVLVVDDDAFNLELLQELFSHKQIEVDLVSSGYEALQKLKTKSYHSLISDIHMPGLDGITILKEIEDLYPDMKRIALTADVTTKFKQYGFYATVTKPINPVELFSALLQREPKDNQTSALNTYPSGLYDLSDIYVFANNEPGAVKAILEAFIETVSSDLKLIRQHVNQNNWIALAERAHKMVAPCAQLKSERLVNALSRLESQEWQSIHDLELIVADVASLIETLNELLKSEIAGLSKENKVKAF